LYWGKCADPTFVQKTEAALCFRYGVPNIYFLGRVLLLEYRLIFGILWSTTPFEYQKSQVHTDIHIVRVEHTQEYPSMGLGT
jgi:hypothetical protein